MCRTSWVLSLIQSSKETWHTLGRGTISTNTNTQALSWTKWTRYVDRIRSFRTLKHAVCHSKNYHLVFGTFCWPQAWLLSPLKGIRSKGQRRWVALSLLERRNFRKSKDSRWHVVLNLRWFEGFHNLLRTAQRFVFEPWSIEYTFFSSTFWSLFLAIRIGALDGVSESCRLQSNQTQNQERTSEQTSEGGCVLASISGRRKKCRWYSRCNRSSWTVHKNRKSIALQPRSSSMQMALCGGRVVLPDIVTTTCQSSLDEIHLGPLL